jgi:hypothetical protein
VQLVNAQRGSTNNMADKKEEKRLPKGTHTSETDAKNRKVIRELHRPSNTQDEGTKE